MPKIVLIHAMRESIPPIETAFLQWPDARLTHLLDDSLPGDLQAEGGLTDFITERMAKLAEYAIGCRAEAVLFTCSAFGRAIEVVAARFAATPIFKPNQAMVDEAARRGGKVRLLATFEPTIRSMMAEFPPQVDVEPVFVPEALDYLKAGDGVSHDACIRRAALRTPRAGVVCLAQFSMARAAATLAGSADLAVLTAPQEAVARLKLVLSPQERSLAPDG